jgi:hypothetical protein
VAITLYGNPVDPSGAKVSGVVHVSLIDGGGAGHVPSVTEDTHVLSLWISAFDKDRAAGVNGWSIPVTANDLITPSGTYYYIREITPNGTGQTVKEFYVELSTARTTGEGSGPWEVGDPLLQVVPFVPPPFTPIAGPQGPAGTPTSEIMQAAVAAYLVGVDLLQSTNYLSEFDADTDLTARAQLWANLGITFGQAAGEFVEGDDVRLTTVGSGPPSGDAGGVLSGTYPNPGFAFPVATQASLNTEITAREDADTTESTARGVDIDGVNNRIDSLDYLAVGADQAGAAAAAQTAAIATAEGYTDTVAAGKADLVGGVVPTAQIPVIAITDTFTVASQAAMLALTAQKGDVAVRTDLSRTYILSTNSPGTLADWIQLPIPTDLVLSVNGQTGAVTLGYADVGAASTLDTRLTNARTPTAHHTTHESGGSDALALAESQVTNLVTDLAAKASATLALGGRLSGNLPNPTIPAGAITDTDVNAAAGIARTKIAAPEAWHVVNAAGGAAPAFNTSYASLSALGAQWAQVAY